LSCVPEVGDDCFSGIETMTIGEMVGEIFIGGIEDIHCFPVVNIRHESFVKNRLFFTECRFVELDKVRFSKNGLTSETDLPMGQVVFVSE